MKRRILNIAFFVFILNVWSASCIRGNEEHDVIKVSDPVVPQKKPKRATGDCGGTFSSDSGVITSPSYPGVYGNNEDCIYYITVSSGYFIKLIFSVFNTEANIDRVEIFDGPSVYHQLIRTYSGDSIPVPVTSPGSSITVRFTSDGSVNEAGFFATYSATLTDPGVGLCGGSFTTDSGHFSSPNYPSFYDNDQDCFYMISVSAGNKVKLTFTYFSTESCCDSVKVYDGLESTDLLLGTFSGDVVPYTITSSGSSLYVHFQSDSSSKDKGFYAVYSTTMGLHVSPSYSVCSDNVVHGLGGLIYSHDDYPASYPESMTCSLTISTVSVYDKIYLKFLSVDMYDPYDRECGSFDYIRITDGIGSELDTICKSNETNDYVIAGGSVTITFTATDNVLSSDVSGFKAVFALYYYNLNPCVIESDFKCDNNRCISGMLSCDGNDNCGDGSDENDCIISSAVGIIVGSVFGILFVLMFITFIVCCCKAMCSSKSGTDRRGRRSRSALPKSSTTAPPPVNYSQGQVNINTAPHGQYPAGYGNVQQNVGYEQPAVYNPGQVPGQTYPPYGYQVPSAAAQIPMDPAYRAQTPGPGMVAPGFNDTAYPPNPVYPPQPTSYDPTYPPPSRDQVPSHV